MPAAVEFGVNANPFLPTSTTCVTAPARERRAAEARRLVLENIL